MHLNLESKINVLIFLIIVLLSPGCNNEVDAQQTAPDFTLQDLSGNNVSLKDYRGHIVLLDFWATWCPPCRRSIPELVELQKRYRDQGVIILGISLDDPRMFNNKYLLEYKKKHKMNYRILRVDNNVIQDYLGGGNVAIPTMFVINREGKIVEKHVGFAPGKTEKSLKKLI